MLWVIIILALLAAFIGGIFASPWLWLILIIAVALSLFGAFDNRRQRP